VKWPRIANGADSVTYDVIRTLRVGSVGSVYPYAGGCGGGTGTVCGYVAQGLSQLTACSGGLVCTYTDSGSASTLAYSVNPSLHPLIGTYTGTINFWPGAMVVTSYNTHPSIKVDYEQTPIVGIGLSGNAAQVASECTDDGGTSAGGYTTCLGSITTMNNAVTAQSATLLSDGGFTSPVGSNSFPKGRLNFTNVAGLNIYPHHIITLLDSQPGLTQATVGYRPTASANDVWIGTDSPAGTSATAGKLAFGSPVSISNYIGNTGDNVHFFERLTATQKTFNLPIQITAVTFATLPACSSTTEGMQNPVQDSTTNTWGATITGSGVDHVLAYCDGTNWTVAAK
jgi:hypothetical protein